MAKITIPLTIFGSRTYSLIRNAVAPGKPKDKSHNHFVKNHVFPAVSKADTAYGCEYGAN